jgi:enduracididine beta-hydroxylase
VMISYELTDADRRCADQAIGQLVSLGLPAEDPNLLEATTVAGHTLSRALREKLVAFRLREEASALLIRGLPVRDDDLGPTPGYYRKPPLGTVTREDSCLLLVASLLGDVFGWTTQQYGRVVQDVLPIRGHEEEQVSSNSAAVLGWHVEDGWCEERPDYVGLLCLRNPDGVVTRYVDVSHLPISAADRELLAEPEFLIRGDLSHTPDHNDAGTADSAAFGQVASHEKLMPVLSGDLASPYVRFDADFMEVPASREHADALTRLRALIDSSSAEVILAPGDLLIMDNLRAVHGRAPFRARFDGTDRWLLRAYVTRDLRKSLSMRQGVTGRLLFA